ncbi:flagellar biosynthesis anti-sigma factor FlgM [bacterium]|nr:flagellar biosynthesis anti-sigma factor FlgM [bacterium]
MKISQVESGKAALKTTAPQSRILPKDRPRGLVSTRAQDAKNLSPLEQGMAVAEAAMADVPDIREDIVNKLKDQIAKGEYKIDGKEVAEMMIRRLEADRIR